MSVVISMLRCQTCDNIMYVPRRTGKQRKRGHFKDMWCPYCQQERKFMECRGFVRNGLGEEVMLK